MLQRIAINFGGGREQKTRFFGFGEAERVMRAEGTDLQRRDWQLKVIDRACLKGSHYIWLICVLVEETLQQRQPHDLQVEPHGPILNVIQVVLDALFQRRVAAPSVYLRPASQAGLYFVAKHVLRDFVLEL